MSDLKNIRARITTLSLAANLPPSVWSDLCLIDSELSVLCAAQAADEGRVRSVVREAIMDKLGDLYCVIDGRHLTRAGIEAVADAIATRAAKQLAGAAVRLKMPDELEWTPEAAERQECESADYVEGWNDALQAVEAINS